MKRKCPICDTRNDIAASKCKMCGFVFTDPPVDTVKVVQLGSAAPMKRVRIVIAIAILLLATVTIVAVYMFAYAGSSKPAVLTEKLASSVYPYSFSHTTIVVVRLNGYITNHGDERVQALVTIEVFDGSSWKTYQTTTDFIHADGGMLWFQWSQNYPYSDYTAFEVRYEVEAV